MRSLLAAVFLLWGGVAWAQTPAQLPYVQTGGDASTNTSLSTGSSTARTLAAREADVINAKDYGAIGNDTADDTAALNSALAAFRTAIAGGNAATLVIPYGWYRTTGPLNFSGLRAKGATINAWGVVIDPQFTGGIAVDATYSRYLIINGLSIKNETGYLPAVGLAVGRDGTSVADDLSLNDITVSGYFSTCAIYNRASETDVWDHVISWNDYVSPTAYAYCGDGINYWQIQSSFQSNTAPANTGQSFTANVYIDPDFRSYGGSPPVWLAHANGHRFIGGYALNDDSTGGGTYCGAILYVLAGDSYGMPNLYWDMHTEYTGSLTDQLCITGTAASANFDKMTVIDTNSEASNSIFKLQGSVSSVFIGGLDLQIGGNSFSKIFDTTSGWAVSGQYYLPSGSTQWNLPNSQFSGRATVGASSWFVAPQYLVAGLPTCNSSSTGQTATVTNATSPTYNATLTGGGSVTVPAYCNGTNWVAH